MKRTWLLLALTIAYQDRLAAQETGLAGLAIGGNVGILDVRGSPRTAMVSARLDLPLSPTMLLDVGAAWFSLDNQTNNPQDTTPGFLLPDAGLEFQLPLGRARPYLGVGAGLAFDLRNQAGPVLAIHAAAGLRVDVWDRWGIRLEGRIRDLGTLGTSRELSIGVTMRLRRLAWPLD